MFRQRLHLKDKFPKENKNKHCPDLFNVFLSAHPSTTEAYQTGLKFMAETEICLSVSTWTAFADMIILSYSHHCVKRVS